MSDKDFTTGDNATIAYTDEGSGPAVILIHGLGCRGAHWALQTPALVDAGYRVIAMDLRFHGDSESTSHGHRISRLAQDLLELIDTESLEEVTVIAHSMGVSVTLAAVSLRGADWLSKAVLIDQSPRIINGEGWPHGVHGVTWHDLEGHLDGSVPWGRFEREPTRPQPMMDLMAKHPLADMFNGPHRDLVMDHFVADWRDVLQQLNVPVMIAAGVSSMSFPIESMRWMAGALPQGTLLEFADSGHTPHWNEHEAFNRALLEFLASDA